MSTMQGQCNKIVVVYWELQQFLITTYHYGHDKCWCKTHFV